MLRYVANCETISLRIYRALCINQGKCSDASKPSESTHNISGIKPIMMFRGVVGAFTKFEESNRLSRLVVAGILSLFTTAHFQSLPLAHQMAKRSRPITDEASKDTGASSNSKPKGKRGPSLAAVRQRKSSPLISAQEMTRSDVKGQENSGQASCDRKHFPGVQALGDRSRMTQPLDDPSQKGSGQVSCDPKHFPGPTGNPEVTKPAASDLEGSCWMPNENSRMHRRHLHRVTKISMRNIAVHVERK